MKGFLIHLSVRTRVAQGHFDNFDFRSQLTISPSILNHSNQCGQTVGRLQKADLLIMGSGFSVIRGAASASERSSIQLIVPGGKEAAGALGEVLSEARMDVKKTCVSFRSTHLSDLDLAEPYLRLDMLNHFDVV